MYDIERRKQVKVLQKLISEIASLNQGSNFLDKTERCIEMAKELLEDDLSIPRESFVDFIHNEAVKENQTR